MDAYKFLSTPPSRVATAKWWVHFVEANVSIHATLAGGDIVHVVNFALNVGVSIHATLAGGDALCCISGNSSACFYPRHPRGWRRDTGRFRHGCGRFLSTPPSRVATILISRGGGGYAVFLSTPPSRVATRTQFRELRPSRCFYPRHPRGWRRSHTRGSAGLFSCFYPRHPRGWRRSFFFSLESQLTVSIHATLAGGDSSRGSTAFLFSKFLSTPPSRVATLHSSAKSLFFVSFYPRHPRGWRRNSAGNGSNDK